MLYSLARIVINLIVILHCVSSEKSSTKNENISEDDYQMCAESFDVHKDKIIRTEDSLALGAKYIMEADVNDRQHCLRFCCKTYQCDVFIFEEKKQGSCYLFHCGPPHDFKCKFTSHANYSSAVRLENNVRSQQEHELQSLRKIGNRESQEITENIVIQVTESPKVLIPVTTTTAAPPKPICSRNQYECRTSGDCIAIYNVCDGIPQCSDSSDEAADLGCPVEKPTPALVAQDLPQVVGGKLAEGLLLQHHKNHIPVLYKNAEKSATAWSVPLSAQQAFPQQQQPQNAGYPQQAVMMPVAPINYGAPGYLSEWEYRQMLDQAKEGYVINPVHGKADMTHYNHEEPRIFNHKRPGMVADTAGNVYPELVRPYDPYYPRAGHEAWQAPPEQPPDGQMKLQTAPTIAPPRQNKDQNAVLVQQHPVVDEEKSGKDTLSIKKELESQKHLHAPVKDSSVDKPVVMAKNTNLKNVVEKDQRPTVDAKHEEVRIHHFVAEHLHQNNHQDYEVLQPKGAVISLTLGLTVTLIMVALITCRLRVVRRRGRRGHGPYAHDADYLVNGMYL